MKRRLSFTVIGIIVLLLILAGTVIDSTSAVSWDEIAELNPEFAALEYPYSLPPFSLETLEGSEDIVAIRTVYGAYAIGWNPWFDQQQGTPDRILGDGQLYSQHIFLARPAGEAVRSLVDRPHSAFAERLSLNFYDLKTVNPSLEYYERLPTGLDSQGHMFFYAPRGSGIAFIADDRGDIYSVLNIIIQEGPARSWHANNVEGQTYHPDLGDIQYYNVLLREPEGRFDLESWFISQHLARIKTAAGDRLGRDFVVEEISLSPGIAAALMDIEVKLHNTSDSNYTMPIFRMALYDQKGLQIGEGALVAAGGIAGGATVTLTGMAMLERMIDIDEIICALEYTPLF